MALTIDQRLLEPDGEMELIENFNRLVNLLEGILPAVTSEDVNKVLSVDEDGEWVVVDAASSLPDVTSEDNNKILAVVEGVWTVSNAPSSMPAVTSSDNGKILTVSNGEWVASTPANELPAVTSSDEGKFLVVNSSGEWVATAVPDAEDLSF